MWMALPPVPPRLKWPRRGMRAQSSTFAVGVRLCAAIAATFALLGAAGYLMIGHQLQRRLVGTYAGEHRADARSFGDIQLRAPHAFAAHARIATLLAAIA